MMTKNLVATIILAISFIILYMAFYVKANGAYLPTNNYITAASIFISLSIFWLIYT